MEASAMNGVGGASCNSLCCPPSDQLTLSFQGKVYGFDAVSPEKVQAVLLLLGDTKFLWIFILLMWLPKIRGPQVTFTLI